MTIPVGSAFKAALEAEGKPTAAQPVFIIFMNFTTGVRRFAMWPYDVTFSGNTFLGLGPIQQVSEVEWSDSPLTEAYLAFFVQNDPDLLADLQQNSRRRRCSIRLVFVDASNQAIDNDLIYIADRNMVPGPIVGSATEYTSAIGIESRLHTHLNEAPRTYSHAEQQRRDATDFAFQDAGKTVDLSRNKYVQKSGLG